MFGGDGLGVPVLCWRSQRSQIINRFLFCNHVKCSQVPHKPALRAVLCFPTTEEAGNMRAGEFRAMLQGRRFHVFFL